MAGASPNPPPGDPPEQQPSAGEAFSPEALLARLWQRNLSVFRDRVALLGQAASAAAAGSLTPELRTLAIDAAHKLAGSLGMFGYPRGTDIAREFEHALEASGPLDAATLLDLAAELRSLLPL